MTQKEFLNSLSEELKRHGVEKVNDILADYQEHFTHGLQNGQTEQQIAEKLGNPHLLAKAYETEGMIAKIKSSNADFQWETAFRVIGRLIVLAPFNLFFLLIPGILIFALMVAGWSVVLGLISAAVALFSVAFKIGFVGFSVWVFIALASASLGVLGLCLIAGLLMFAVSKQIIIILIHYLQWNLKYALEK